MSATAAQPAPETPLAARAGQADVERGLYRSLGYGDFGLDPHMGHALFWQKVLD